MISIRLIRNNAFTWHTQNGVSVKGYLFSPQGELFQDDLLLSYFSGVENQIDLEKALVSANGIYSVIIHKGNSVFVGVDRFRTFPIFYRKTQTDLYISDEVSELFNINETYEISEEVSDVFSGFGYTLGNTTLIKNVKQVQAGEYIWTNSNSISEKFYHTYMAQTESTEYNIAKIELKQIFANIIERLALQLKNKSIALPLSGGLDSRLIAYMLKKAEISDVTCFTFGTKKNNPELQRAEVVAKKLDFAWNFIDYDTINKTDFYKDPTFLHFYKYESQYVSKFAFMQYFAASYLKETLNIKDGTYILPGHGGDFFSGSHLRPYMANYKTIKPIVADIQYIHCELVEYTSKQRKVSKKYIREQLNNELPLYNNIENWNLKERQAKYIINSCKLWEQFSLPYYMPLCDNEFVDFFVKLPFEYRLHQKLYREVVGELFDEYDLNFKEDKKQFESSLLQKVKIFIKRHLPFIRKKVDLFQFDYFDFETTAKPIIEILKSHKVFDKIRTMNGIFTEWILIQIKNESQIKKTNT